MYWTDEAVELQGHRLAQRYLTLSPHFRRVLLERLAQENPRVYGQVVADLHALEGKTRPQPQSLFRPGWMDKGERKECMLIAAVCGAMTLAAVGLSFLLNKLLDR
jgi:hypothetical protein